MSTKMNESGQKRNILQKGTKAVKRECPVVGTLLGCLNGDKEDNSDDAAFSPGQLHFQTSQISKREISIRPAVRPTFTQNSHIIGHK